MARVLVACEESQRVCAAFRERGHEAFSSDVQRCSGGHPEWHILGDALLVIGGNCQFITEAGGRHEVPGRWDLIIAHPPCTYLTPAGSCRMFRADHSVVCGERWERMQEAAEFLMRFLRAPCAHIAVENHAPMKCARLPQYSQIVEPYFFGDPWKKRTCLWLVGLPPLRADAPVEPKACWVETNGRTTRTKLRTPGICGARDAKTRSRTFEGMARAMAEQWGPLLCGERYGGETSRLERAWGAGEQIKIG